jgi:hypothetical protein
MAKIPYPWPSEKILDDLTDKSSGYFIYASTVIKFIDNKDFRPTERLQVILGIKKSDSGSPFAALDQLYTQILSQVDARTRLLHLLTVIACKLQLCIGSIEELFALESGDVELTFRGLQSVIGATKDSRAGGSDSNDWSLESHLVVHHASFYDFLGDPERAGVFHVGSSSHHWMNLCCRILQLFSYQDRFTKLRDDIAWYTLFQSKQDDFLLI